MGFSPKGRKESDTTERPNKNSVVAHDDFHIKCKCLLFSHSIGATINYIYVKLNHFAIPQKVRQHCKSFIFQF